jgi:A/G-specific adenine glycosylase
MAQQTQIARVEPAWAAFLERFPTVEALAAAPVADVLRAWQGMGYNRRALNLQRAARTIVSEHGGRIPDDVDALCRLPGVGPYTARAVAAIAFGRRVGAVDTNVRRVLGRAVLGQEEAAHGPTIQSLADDLVPAGMAGEWTHALMDIGARFCRPRAPRCDECPLAAQCRFRGQATGRAFARTSRARARGPARPFPSTTRWLRGRLLDRARAGADGEWVRVDVAIESHPGDHAMAAARAMAAEGLLELHPSDPGLARLPR